MSAAINHVRLLAPEDFFAPIALVMKALGAMRLSRNFGKAQPGVHNSCTYSRENNGVDDDRNDCRENDCSAIL